MRIFKWIRANVLVFVTLCTATLMALGGVYFVAEGVYVGVRFADYDGVLYTEDVTFDLIGVPVLVLGVVNVIVAGFTCFAALRSVNCLGISMALMLLLIAFLELALVALAVGAGRYQVKVNGVIFNGLYDYIGHALDEAFLREFNQQHSSPQVPPKKKKGGAGSLWGIQNHRQHGTLTPKRLQKVPPKDVTSDHELEACKGSRVRLAERPHKAWRFRRETRRGPGERPLLARRPSDAQWRSAWGEAQRMRAGAPGEGDARGMPRSSPSGGGWKLLVLMIAKSDLFDAMHKELRCCGSNGPEDFISMRLPLPGSCCPSTELACSPSRAYRQGCKQPFVAWLRDNVTGLGVVSALACLATVAVAVSACALAVINYRKPQKKTTEVV